MLDFIIFIHYFYCPVVTRIEPVLFATMNVTCCYSGMPLSSASTSLPGKRRRGRGLHGPAVAGGLFAVDEPIHPLPVRPITQTQTLPFSVGLPSASTLATLALHRPVVLSPVARLASTMTMAECQEIVDTYWWLFVKLARYYNLCVG